MVLLILFGPLLAFSAEVGNPSGSSSGNQDLANSSPFLSDAQRCGTTMQSKNLPNGGTPMCGRAVAQMLKCMAAGNKNASSCQGSCGNGKDFVECKNGQLGKCGYEKVNPKDKRCSMPGAVLAYSSHEKTKAGKKYGHVEMVCGVDKYCSVYKKEHNKPWPKPVADGCWAPKSDSFDKKVSASKGK